MVIPGKIIIEAALLIYIGIGAYEDIKHESLSLIYLAAGGLTGIILQLTLGHKNFMYLAEGALVGLVLLLVAYSSRQAIGYGDAIMFMVTGIFAGLVGNILLLLVSLILSSLASVVLVIFKVKKGKDRVPLVPFILTGFVLMLAFTGG